MDIIGKPAHYVGSWGNINLGLLYAKSVKEPIIKPITQTNFYLLFNGLNRDPNKSENFYFKASILDIFGEAECLGVLTPETITFEKRYSPSAINKGGAECAVYYKGLRSKEEDLEFVAGLIRGRTIPSHVFAMVRTKTPTDFPFI